MMAFCRTMDCMGFITLTFVLLAHQSLFAHGGDSHDISPTQLLEMKAHDADHDEHGHSRFSYIVIGSTSQNMRAEEKHTKSHETTLSDRHQLNGSINYHLNDVWALSLAGGATRDSGIQDPSLGSSTTFPIAETQFQFIGMSSVAPAVSAHSLEQGRVATLNLFMGVSATLKRWTVGFYGGSAIPAYGGPVKDEVHPMEDLNELDHQDGRERFRTSGALRASFKLSKSFKLDSSYDLTLINKPKTWAYASELILTRLSYIEKGWQAGVAFVMQDESGVFRVPLEPLARISITVLR